MVGNMGILVQSVEKQALPSKDETLYMTIKKLNCIQKEENHRVTEANILHFMITTSITCYERLPIVFGFRRAAMQICAVSFPPNSLCQLTLGCLDEPSRSWLLIHFSFFSFPGFYTEYLDLFVFLNVVFTLQMVFVCFVTSVFLFFMSILG